MMTCRRQRGWKSLAALKSMNLSSKERRASNQIPYGRVAEWPIAAVLKTVVGQPTVGSNPTSSDFFFRKNSEEVSQEFGSRVDSK
jgi:hypothetical protein